MRTFILTLLLTLTFHPIMAQKVTSILEIYDITTGQRTVVKEFSKHLIEAPNWTPDGQWLVYNSHGKLYKLSPDKPEAPILIHTDFATRCNNDHVISADGRQIAISHGTKEEKHVDNKQILCYCRYIVHSLLFQWDIHRQIPLA